MSTLNCSDLGVTEALPKAEISYDRFHVVALAMEAMDVVRRQEMTDEGHRVRAELGEREPKDGAGPRYEPLSRAPFVPRGQARLPPPSG